MAGRNRRYGSDAERKAAWRARQREEGTVVELPGSEDAWVRRQQAHPTVHDARVKLVRQYVAAPGKWPDGIDWPGWDEPHELWYTGHEGYWAGARLLLERDHEGA